VGTRGNGISGFGLLKALVLDAHSRAAIESIQSLARHGVEVDAATGKDSLTSRSKRVRHCIRQPQAGQTDLFLRWLAQLDRDEGYSLIIPSTEESLRHFLSVAESNPLRMKTVLASNASLRVALDKALTVQLASKLGIPVPETVLIRRGEDTPVCNLYPAVLKPVSSIVISEGVAKLLQSRIVRNEFERQEALRDMLAHSAVLQQELVSGTGVGVEMLYRKGKPLWHFSHKRLHEGSGLPGLGSGSSYRQSVAPNQDLLLHSIAILDALGWHGAAMVEYKVAEGGRFWLMEINPRLWGSVALAIDAGVDFPYGLFCLATGREVSSQPDYSVGYRTRLVWQDLDWIRNRFFFRPNADACMEILKLLRPLFRGESWDFFDWGDLGLTAAGFRNFALEKIGSLKRKRVKSQEKRAASKLHGQNMHRILVDKERRPRRILFLCYGNICRSPVAESLLRARYPEVEVQSAGFHDVVGRGVPPHVRSAAAEYSIDVSNCASRRVTTEMIRDADVIFLHDMRNYERFCLEFPNHTSKILFLGLCGEPPILEIEDPYSLDKDATAAIVGQISAAIDGAGAKLLDFTRKRK
jgi:protein-tyrosine-phosphatase/predicted ATP-grasp superfamily ATP-dependent carboligase